MCQKLKKRIYRYNINFPPHLGIKTFFILLRNLQCPLDLDKVKVRYFKLKAMRYCIINDHLFWKDPRGILLNCINEDEEERITVEFHIGSCEGNHL